MFFIATVVLPWEGYATDASQETCPIQKKMFNFRDKSLSMPRHTYTRTYVQKMKLPFKALLIFGFLTSSTLFSQTNASRVKDTTNLTILPEVILTDVKSPFGFDYKGATQIILNAQDLTPYRGRGIAVALNRLAGLEVNGARGAQGIVLNLYARGGRGKQSLIIIDGVRVADPASASLSFDLRLLDLSQIESIKVVKGANSSLYGTNAAAVVIDITTKKHQGSKTSVALNVIGGTHQSAQEVNHALNNTKYQTRISGGGNTWNYTLSYSAQKAKGLSSFKTPLGEEDPFEQESIGVRVEKNFSPTFTAAIFADQQFMKASYDDAFMGVDADNFFETKRNQIGAGWFWKQQKAVFKSTVSFSSYDSKDTSAFGSEVLAHSLNADVVYRVFFDSHWNLISGFQMAKDAIAANKTTDTPSSDYLITDPYLTLGYNRGGFNLQLGGRFNYHSLYKGQWVYHINPNMFLDKQRKFNMHIGWSTAYITPTLGMFFGAYGANKDLRPEQNTNIELGLSFSNVAGTQLGVTYFKRDEQDAIIFNNPAFLYENNTEKTWAKGLEFQGGTRLVNHLELTANYSLVWVSETAIRIPKHKVNINALYTFGAAKHISLMYAYTGQRTDTDFTTYENVTLDAFSLIDIQYNFPIIGKLFTGFLSVNNLTNIAFEETVGYQTLGRNYNIGLSYQL